MTTQVSTPGAVELRGLIRDVPDFPKPGILFRDITPLLQDPAFGGAGGRGPGLVESVVDASVGQVREALLGEGGAEPVAAETLEAGAVMFSDDARSVQGVSGDAGALLG